MLRDATARAACSVSEGIENAGNTSTERTGCSTGRRVTQHGLSRHTPVSAPVCSSTLGETFAHIPLPPQVFHGTGKLSAPEVWSGPLAAAVGHTQSELRPMVRRLAKMLVRIASHTHKVSLRRTRSLRTTHARTPSWSV